MDAFNHWRQGTIYSPHFAEINLSIKFFYQFIDLISIWYRLIWFCWMNIHPPEWWMEWGGLDCGQQGGLGDHPLIQPQSRTSHPLIQPELGSIFIPTTLSFSSTTHTHTQSRQAHTSVHSFLHPVSPWLEYMSICFHILLCFLNHVHIISHSWLETTRSHAMYVFNLSFI